VTSNDSSENLDGGMSDGTWDRASLMYGYLSEYDDDQESEGFAERFAAWRQSLRDERERRGQN
jgi:hypothetical protein